MELRVGQKVSKTLRDAAGRIGGVGPIVVEELGGLEENVPKFASVPWCAVSHVIVVVEGVSARDELRDGLSNNPPASNANIAGDSFDAAMELVVDLAVFERSLEFPLN